MSVIDRLCAYEPLTWQHLREYDGGKAWARISDARMRFLPMVGFAARDQQGVIRAIGGVIWFGARAEGMFSMEPEFRSAAHSRWVHRDTIEVLELAHQVSPVIYARIDASIPKAEAWARRLGFVPDRENAGEFWWKREKDVVCSASSYIGGVVHSGQCRDDHGDRVSGGGRSASLRRD